MSKLSVDFAYFEQVISRPETQREVVDDHMKFGAVTFGSDISLRWDAVSEPFDHTGATLSAIQMVLLRLICMGADVPVGR